MKGGMRCEGTERFGGEGKAEVRRKRGSSDEKGAVKGGGKERGNGKKVGKGEGKWNLTHSSFANLSALYNACI